MTDDLAPQATPRTRAKARHILDNYYIGPARDQSVLEIWAYTETFSYAPGETIGLHVSTTATSWDLEVARDGVTLEPVHRALEIPGTYHEAPPDCSVRGCGWPVAYSFHVRPEWQPGGYLLTLRGHRGSETVEEHHLILVRGAPEKKPAPLLLVCATGTWVAYNCWGGSNAYEGLCGPDGRSYSPVLSTQRPWTRGFCRLPNGAPRTLPETPPKPGEMVRYPYMEWAYAYGYSKKYASAGWASYERHFARWLEAEGYDFDVATQHDLHLQPDLLSRYPCALFVGHDEYWSGRMRDAVDAFVEAGGRVARFAGNFLWQIRLEDGGHTQVCYKYRAVEDDPVMGTPDQAGLTGAWEMPEVGRPGASTFAVNALRGIYAGLGNCVGRGSGGFTVYRPEHWAFDGAYLGYGDVLGAASRVYGYEVDGLDHVIRDGLPFPTGTDGAAENVVILAMGLGSNVEADHGIWGEQLYIGDEDLDWTANALFGAVTPETRDSAARGNGVIVSWQRGRGEVFTAGTCEWVMGLARHDPQIVRVTRNVLDRFIEAS